MTSLPALHLPGYVDGIDVSSVQRIEDPAAVYEAGFRFAFVKATEGLRGRDPAYRRHVDALQGAGLHVGAYAYARVSQGDPAARHAPSDRLGERLRQMREARERAGASCP